jgi:hypothetical protein|nr:hypothetical protein [Candidatus Krumholzibacteria bacterium]
MFRRLFCVVLLGVGLLAGCSDDERAPLDPEGSAGLPASADELMADFGAAYQSRDESDLTRLLHPATQVFLLDSTVEAFLQGGNPLGFDRMEHDAVVSSHRHLFSETAGTGPAGQVVPPVVSIEVDYLVQDGGWEPYVDVGGDFPGLQVRSGRFHLQLHFNCPDNLRMVVQCDALFLAVEDEENSGWQLIGWRDLEPQEKAQAVEPVSLSSILAIYH